MADCGATGTALDRVVSAATSNGGASKEAVALLVGHASVGPTASSVGGMPAAPPTFLSTNHSGLVQQQQESSTACARPHLYGTGPAVLMHSPHHYGTMMQHPNRHSQYAAMQQQQQQQHMMMMHQQQQQQQQMAMMHQQQQLMMQQAQQQQQQQQQQQAQQQQRNKAKLKDDEVYHENDAQTERASNTERTIEDWHDGLEEEEGHEGLTRGVTMEELAAAWAQAEAEYEYEEYVEKCVKLRSVSIRVAHVLLLLLCFECHAVLQSILAPSIINNGRRMFRLYFHMTMKRRSIQHFLRILSTARLIG
jgi:hypothetical protein